MYDVFYENSEVINFEDISLKEIKSLLERLTDETIYVELKERFDEKVKKKIPAILSSLANEQGGYIIVGIQDVSKEIVGIDREDFDQIIGNIVRHKISPFLVYKLRIIPIENNKIILLIQVPKGSDTPYIVDGTIYRRIGNNSIGTYPIKDRYDFEQLIKRGRSRKKEISSFAKRKVFIEEESWIPSSITSKGYYLPKPICSIYFMLPDNNNEFININLEDKINDIQAEFQKVHKVKSKDVDISVQVPFPRVSFSQHSIILRNSQEENFVQNTMIWEFFDNGSSRVHFPIQLNNSLDNDQNTDEDINYTQINGKDFLKSVLSVLTIIQSITDTYYSNQFRYIIRIDIQNVKGHVLNIGGNKYREFIKNVPTLFSERENYSINKNMTPSNLPLDWVTSLVYIGQIGSCFGLSPVDSAIMFTEVMLT